MTGQEYEKDENGNGKHEELEQPGGEETGRERMTQPHHKKQPKYSPITVSDNVQGACSSSQSPSSPPPSLPETAASRCVVSIDDAIERLGMGWFQARILIAAGLCFAADGMEVLLLTFLAVVLEAEWGLSGQQTSALASSVFVGALVGTLSLGWLGDRIGRRPVFAITAAIIAVAGFATAAAYSFPVLVLFRFLVGFGVGGLTVPFDTLAEFVPTSHRGGHLLLVQYFWTVGSLLVAVAAYLTIGEAQDGDYYRNGWRVFVVLCAIPCLLSTILGLVFVPESPRWLLTQGKHDEAVAVLRMAATRNGLDPMQTFPEGTVLRDDELGENTNICDLFAPNWIRITLLMWLSWAGMAFTYYGAVIVTTRVFSTGEQGQKVAVTGNNSTDYGTSNEAAGGRYSFDYGAILVSGSSEIAGTTLVILLVDRIGRIPSQTLSYFFGGIMALALCLVAAAQEESDGGATSSATTGMLVAAFGARLFFMSASCVTWVSAPEILTTEVRTVGHGAANAVARVGGAISPYLVKAPTPLPTVGIIMLFVSLATALASCHLPETCGKGMGSVVPHKQSGLPQGEEPREDQQHQQQSPSPSNVQNDGHEQEKSLELV